MIVSLRSGITELLFDILAFDLAAGGDRRCRQSGYCRGQHQQASQKGVRIFHRMLLSVCFVLIDENNLPVRA